MPRGPACPDPDVKYALPASILRAAALAACAALPGCAHYHPRPVTVAALRQSLESRTLAAAPLHAWLHDHLGRTAPPWDVDALTGAAWYFSPELDQARAQSTAASAAAITAGQRPVPTLSLPFEYTTNPKPDESPYTLGLALDIPVEVAGKRGYRVAHARALSLASRFEIGVTAWRIRQKLRAALLALWDANARTALLQEDLVLREHLLRLLERRLALGEAARPEVASVRAQVASDRAQLLQGKRDAAEALASAAGVIGIPAAALQHERLDLHSFAVDAHEPHRGTLLDAALRNRADIQAGLARYEASQSALQLAVADQYPDVHLGPGYTYDAGAHKIAFNLSGIAISLPRNNRGPIAQAQAKRREAATQVEAGIASALAQVDQGLAAWTPAAAALRSAREAARQQQAVVHAAAEALRLGEQDRPALLRAQLDANAARLDAQQARLALQKTTGVLEDAVQQPLEPGHGSVPAAGSGR
jgi:outer membrane protein TolC